MAKALTVFAMVAATLLSLAKIPEAASATKHQLKVFDMYKTIYYNPVTNETLKMKIENIAKFPFTMLGFSGMPCACQDLSCGCCAGINITRIQFDQKACTNFTYDPHEFAIRMEVAMNDNKIFENKISARNPPPFCFPFPNVPVVDFCLRFHSLSTQGNNLQACLDFETRIIQSPIMVLHFDCIKIGADGISWIKPDDIGASEGAGSDYVNLPIAEPEVYDEVNFESNVSEPPANDNSTVSSEDDDEEDDDDKIGQLKL